MAVRVHATWDWERIGSFQLTVEEETGPVADVIAFTTGQACHIDLSSVLSDVEELAQALEDELNASATLNGTYTVTFDTTTLKLTIACDRSFRFTAANTVATQVLGYTSAFGYTASWTSDVRCRYSLPGQQGGISNDSGPVEPRDIAEDVESGEVDHGGIVDGAVAQYRQFDLPCETYERTEKLAPSAEVWTWEEFIEHVRNTEPFAVVTDSWTRVYYQLGTHASKPAFISRLHPNFNDWWDIHFVLRFIGEV